MSLATLSIDLEARLAKFEGDMGKATRILQKLGDNASTAGGRVAEIFAGNFLASAAQEGLQRLIGLFPKLIDGAAAFQDLADETGASAEGLARMQTAADVSGVSVENLAGMMVKLTGNLSKLTDDSKGAGLALTNLGIPLKEFRELSPDQQVARLSAAFNSFADGSTKTSNALALFGKSGAQVLKFFKEFGDGTEQATRLTGDMIRAADAFGDASAKSSSELRQTAQVIALQALPALTALKKGLSDGALAIFDFKGAGAALKIDTAILDFAEGAAVAVGTVAEALTGLIKLARAVGGSFQSVGADIALPFNVAAAAAGVLQGKSVAEAAVGVSRAMQERNRIVDESNRRYVDLWSYNGTAVTDAIRKSFAAQRAVLTAPESLKDTRGIPGENKPNLPPVTVPSEEDNKAEDAFRRFMAQIEKRKAESQAELELGQKLAESDKFRIDVLAKLGEEQGKLAAGAPAKIRSALDEAVAVLKLNEARQEEFKARQATAKLDDKYQAATDARIAAIMGENEALELNIEQLGKTADAIEVLRLKKLQQLRDERAGDPGSSDREINLLDRKIKLTQELIDKRNFAATDALTGASSALGEYLDAVARTGDATREAAGQSIALLEDDLTAGLAKGQISVSRTVDFMIAEFLRLQIVRPMLASLFGSGAGASSLLSTIFGGSLFGGGSVGAVNARGNAFGASGAIPFAMGGVVGGATAFSFAGGRTGVMGEAGPEGVLPLKRGRDGKLGVTASGVGGGVTVVQNITVQSGASRNEVLQAAAIAEENAVARISDLMRRGSGRLQA